MRLDDIKKFFINVFSGESSNFKISRGKPAEPQASHHLQTISPGGFTEKSVSLIALQSTTTLPYNIHDNYIFTQNEPSQSLIEKLAKILNPDTTPDECSKLKTAQIKFGKINEFHLRDGDSYDLIGAEKLLANTDLQPGDLIDLDFAPHDKKPSIFSKFNTIFTKDKNGQHIQAEGGYNAQIFHLQSLSRANLTADIFYYVAVTEIAEGEDIRVNLNHTPDEIDNIMRNGRPAIGDYSADSSPAT
ncbi:hypothetical protein [Paraburkholderia bonniea]|uniref:hypothetical protein n=1 Tax=Paraburkholderia bonniea TaxID=2152891 RepID=UPI001292A897|nr:hypothetical protein [Paraburkholderia bonniea]